MTARATLLWSADAAPIEVSSRAELESRLHALGAESQRPIVGIVTFADGTAVYVGLGRTEAMLIVHEARAADGLTPEWISVGHPERAGISAFWLLGQHNDYEDRGLLPFADAIRGLGELFDTGRRPDWIRWEDNAF